MSRPHKDVTKTSRIEDYLRDHEFSRRSVIAEATGIHVYAVSVCLRTLKVAGAVDVVVEADGVGWWFLTPETDTRARKILEAKAREGKKQLKKHKKHIITVQRVKS